MGGAESPRFMLVPIELKAQRALQISSYHAGSCLRTSTGAQHIDAFRTDPPKLGRPIVALDEGASVSCGDLHTCVLSNAGDLRCTGAGSIAAEMGFPVRSLETDEPVLRGVRQLSSGSSYACAIDAERKVYCWGSNGSGQAIRGGPKVVSAPTLVDLGAPADRVVAGVYHSCALVSRAESSQVVCWGDNRFGQCGPSIARPIDGIDDAIDLALGEWHSCALHRGGAVSCWGRGHRGQLGHGRGVEQEARPVLVDTSALR
jgi:alpha-tubulin suppressor-like RCC1 family protein